VSLLPWTPATWQRSQAVQRAHHHQRSQLPWLHVPDHHHQALSDLIINYLLVTTHATDIFNGSPFGPDRKSKASHTRLSNTHLYGTHAPECVGFVRMQKNFYF
jgi:hypothetical protein